MTHPAIKVEGLYKEYVVGHAQERHDTFYELLTSTLKAPLKRVRSLGGQSEEEERFWALQDVNFEIQPGEVVGVIGRNGAGKSTLLKILSRITAPTKGRIEVRGRLASLLEVGTGFHPELSGRENIYLNGAILGMTRKEVARKFDEIVAFAEIEKFIDTPVKRYSSGMYVRLAFAVAAHLEADVLLVDEVLAVGDVEFQKKCLGTMKNVVSQGRTVVFVSHNMGAIEDLCTHCILLKQGLIDRLGMPGEVIPSYFELGAQAGGWGFNGPLAEKVHIDGFEVNGGPIQCLAQVDPSENIEISVRGRSSIEMPDVRFSLTVSHQGTRVCTLHDTAEFTPLASGNFELSFNLPAYLLRPGEYIIGFGGDRGKLAHWFYGANLFQLLIREVWDTHCRSSAKGLINLQSDNQRLQQQTG